MNSKLNTKKNTEPTHDHSPWLSARGLGDQELLLRLATFSKEERKGLAGFLIFLAEVDQRRLYAERGYSSLFAFLTEELHYSEGSAMRRIQAARLATRFPLILERIEIGKLHLSAISMISKILTKENHREILLKAEGLTQRGVERLVAELSGKPSFGERDRIRFLKPEPVVSSSAESTARAAATPPPSSPALSTATDGGTPIPLREESASQELLPASQKRIRKVKIEFIADERILESIEEAKAALSHAHPHLTLEVLFQEALDVLLEKNSKLRKAKRAEERKAKAAKGGEKAEIVQETIQETLQENASKAPPPSPPHPAGGPIQIKREPRTPSLPIQHEVWRRDQGQCTFVSLDGRRCASRVFLEIDHIEPWARGGSSSDPSNLRLRCRCHNLLAARKSYGERKMEAYLQTR